MGIRTEHSKKDSLIGHLFISVAILVASFGYLAIKTARQELGPVSLFMLRNNLVALLVVLLWLFRRPGKIGWNWRVFGILIALAVLRAPVCQILTNIGAKGCSVGLMAVLLATAPLHVSWLGVLVLGERIGLHQIMAIVTAFAGAILPVVVSGYLYFDSLLYPIMLMLAALCAGFIVVLSRKGSLHMSSLDMTSITVVMAAIICLPLNTPTIVSPWRELTPMTWAMVAFMVLGMFLHSLLLFAAVRRLPVATVGTYMFSGMILTVLWGKLLMNEPISWVMMVSVGLVVAGLILNAKRSPSSAGIPSCATVEKGPQEAKGLLCHTSDHRGQDG